MSIYDNLADSDYVDAGKFKAQLQQLGKLQESQDSKMDTNSPHKGIAHGEDSYLRQKLMQEQNPMDQENEEDQSPQKFIGRQSITGDDLMDDELPGPAYGMPKSDLNLLMQQRNKMIFDDNLEMSERKFYDPYLNVPKDSNYGIPQLNKYESKPEFVHPQPYQTPDDTAQVQTAHFKKQTAASDNRGNTDRTQKTDNPEKDQLLIEQRAFQEADEMLRRRQEETGQFGQARHYSPQMKQPKASQEDQISSLLAQLQAPLAMDQPQQYIDIDKAHQQMQESIKQMNLGNAFNGQNSLYELAQRVGQPLSSSNVNSLSNYEGENDFQKFLQGEGSIGSQQYNLGMQSESERGHHAIDQAQQLLIQMQESSVKPVIARKKSGNLYEKENFNGKNIIASEPVYLQNQQQYVQFNQPQQQQHQQQQPPKKQLSLAERARLARQAEQQSYNNQYQGYQQNPNVYHQQQPQAPPQNQMYRQQFDPNQAFQVRDFQASQQLAYTPQSVPFKGQNVDFSRTNKDEKIEKRAALLAQFDDIPIHQLHKADGYQLRNIDDEEGAQTTGRPSIHEVEQTNEGQDLSLKDQCFHGKWKVRQTAFKEINRLFVTYKPQKQLQKEDEMYGDPENPFDTYGPIIGEMIKDNNLTAQYEGLNCLLSFVKLGVDIKSVTFTCCPYLLDKIQHNKANLSDICQRILQQMLKRKQNIFPELLKRLKSKSSKSLVFYLTVMNSALTDQNFTVQDANLKLIFKNCNELLGHNLKEIRDQANQLITFIYQNCEDDIETFCHNLSGLRPVQIKELKDQLSGVDKDQNAEYLVKLFDKNYEGKKDADQPEKSPIVRSKSVESVGDQTKPEEDQTQIDLCNLVPSNFNEIPYINQINTKRKTLEQFNQELQKLISKPQVSSFEGEDQSLVKLNKDYSSIYNIVVHMLEDPNMLVFNEALKTLEYLAILLKSSIKTSKMKQFVQLLADKYKETKTAVLEQSEKTFNAIYENKCLPVKQFYELLINQIAVNHKNHRVKQLVIDRVEIIIQKNFISESKKSVNTQQLLTIFKQIKDKLKQIILKDTSAGVRDAGVSLLASFRIVAGLDGNFDDIQPILEIINSLPKQRITEITSRLETFEEQNGGAVSARDIMQEQRSRSKSRGVSAKSRGGQSQKSQDHTAPVKQEQPPSPKPPGSTGNQRSQFLFETKRAQATVDPQFQASMSEIIMTIKNISQENDRLRTAQIFENFEQGIEELGDEGIQQCKHHIVQCIYWLFTNYPSKVNFLETDRQEAVKAVLNLLKKLYCIDRSVSRVQTTPNGESLELYHAISSAVICFGLIQENYAKKIVQILNILHVATISTEQESTLSFLNVLKQIIIKYAPCPKLLPDSQVLITSNIIYFAAEKIDEFLSKSQSSDSITDGVQLSDFDELSQISQTIIHLLDQNQKEMLIQSLIFLKERMTQYRQNQINAMRNTGQGYNQQNQKQEQEEEEEEEQLQEEDEEEQPQIPRHLEVIELIQSNFEQGLLKMKLLVKDEQNGNVQVTEDQKKQILLLLLKMTTQPYQNQQEQYKQAYSLKALMWLKDEFIGLEETFKLTNDIMDVFAQAILDGKDSSIEQYLLNFWIKDLSLRDLIDRIQVTCRFEPKNSAQYFKILFTWLFNLKISPQNQEEATEWVLEDFRKVAGYIAENIIQSGEQEQFIKISVDKFGAQKVRDFMEIQLIHENTLLIKFLDFFDFRYQGSNLIRISKNNAGDCELSQALFSNSNQMNESLQEPLLTNRSTLLQEMRDKKKLQKEQPDDIESTLAEEKRKYDEIMQRLDKYKSQKSIGEEHIEMPAPRVANTSKGNRPGERPISGRYQASKRHADGITSHDEFVDEEDFKLSTDDRHSIPNYTNEGSEDPKFMQDRINMQRNPVSSKSTKVFGEGLTSATPFEAKQSTQIIEVGSQDFNTNSESFLMQSRQKIKDSVMNQEERMQRLESSQIKVRQYKNEMEQLEEEKRKLEAEKRALFNEQNKETEQWKDRYREMTLKNDEIIQNLAEANQSYMRQVSENENLLKQIQSLQQQHREFTQRYKEMEELLLNSQKQVEEQKIQIEQNSLPRSPSRASTKVSNEEDLHKIEEAFDKNQMMKYGENVGEGQVGVLKIQELLLDSDGANKNLSKSMIQHYQSLKSKLDRMQMIHALKQSLDHEDILFAISIDVYKSLLNFLLRAFSFEKELIERESLARQHEREQQNELTQESQRLVSKLLNSKEFTTSLLCLLNLLKTDAMPDDFSVELSIQDRQYLRVIMRCISRITKALHSENPDLIRAFDVLIEMQKLFVRHPPENLRQDLPCLQDFDFVYRGLKDVSDKMIELQPQKCTSFLDFCDAQSQETEGLYTKPNAFIKYVRQMMQVKQQI